MRCDEIQRSILSGKKGGDIGRHLSDCLECRVFADSLDRFIKAKPDYADYVLPERLDEIVRREAERRLGAMSETASWRESEAGSALSERFGWASWLAAAACLSLASWLAFSSVFQSRGVGSTVPVRAVRSDVSGCVQWRSVDMDDDFTELQIQIELDMAVIHASQAGESDSGGDVFSEPSQEDFVLPPIWS